jgi:hypothetical protein
MAPQAFVFRHRPGRKAPVEMAERRIKSRLVVTTMVVDPAPYDEVDCEIVYLLVRATPQLPVSDFLPDRLRRSVADTATEVDEELSPSVLRSPGTKSVEPRRAVWQWRAPDITHFKLRQMTQFAAPRACKILAVIHDLPYGLPRDAYSFARPTSILGMGVR